jgi:hypothetical protein
MMSDLVKRLRDGCSCNIDSSPCMAEEECRDAYEAADRIEALEAENARLRSLTVSAQVNMELLAQHPHDDPRARMMAQYAADTLKDLSRKMYQDQ